MKDYKYIIKQNKKFSLFISTVLLGAIITTSLLLNQDKTEITYEKGIVSHEQKFQNSFLHSKKKIM